MVIRKAEAPISAPTGKWGIARRQPLSHRSDFPFDPEGQGAGARQILDRKVSPLLFQKAFALFPSMF
jgi:hypothetical protein